MKDMKEIKDETSLCVKRILTDYSDKALETIRKVISGNENTLTNIVHYYNETCSWYISQYGFFHVIKVMPICFNDYELYQYSVKDYLVDKNGAFVEKYLLVGLPGSNEKGFFNSIDEANQAVKRLDNIDKGEF